MFSYRHAFHAGNHADVLKHAMLLHIIDYLTQKDGALMVVDTHAGAGFYGLQDAYAQKSGEYLHGIAKLWDAANLPPLLAQYVDAIRAFNADGVLSRYPGSPVLLQRRLRAHDKLRLFELHTTDFPLLADNMRQLNTSRQIQVQQADGFEGLKAFLPPPSRRGLILIDPSYEDKRDYRRVADALADALKRFATGTYAIWYPVLARPESRNLPTALIRACEAARAKWLHATLQVAQADAEAKGLVASGMLIVNPPYTLHAALNDALPTLQALLTAGPGAAHQLRVSAEK
ncbi:MAG: 23S rRNA (adenine(2030)-N(6))-methyltransferase RlmJ [Burkholderiaceae bacterium]